MESFVKKMGGIAIIVTIIVILFFPNFVGKKLENAISLLDENPKGTVWPVPAGREAMEEAFGGVGTTPVQGTWTAMSKPFPIQANDRQVLAVKVTPVEVPIAPPTKLGSSQYKFTKAGTIDPASVNRIQNQLTLVWVKSPWIEPGDKLEVEKHPVAGMVARPSLGWAM